MKNNMILLKFSRCIEKSIIISAYHVIFHSCFVICQIKLIKYIHEVYRVQSLGNCSLSFILNTRMAKHAPRMKLFNVLSIVECSNYWSICMQKSSNAFLHS